MDPLGNTSWGSRHERQELRSSSASQFTAAPPLQELEGTSRAQPGLAHSGLLRRAGQAHTGIRNSRQRSRRGPRPCLSELVRTALPCRLCGQQPGSRTWKGEKADTSSSAFSPAACTHSAAFVHCREAEGPPGVPWAYRVEPAPPALPTASASDELSCISVDSKSAWEGEAVGAEARAPACDAAPSHAPPAPRCKAILGYLVRPCLKMKNKKIQGCGSVA